MSGKGCEIRPPEKGIPVWMMFAAVVAMIAAVYSNTYSAGWAFDDQVNITENGVVRNPGSLSDIFRYHPGRFLGYLSFAIDYRLWGDNPGPFRIENLCIHLWAAMALLAILRMALGSPALRLKLPARDRDTLALLGALVFACHPLATQAVTYVVQRFESLAAALVFTGVALYMKARLSGGGPRSPRAKAVALYAGSFVAFAAGCFTKQTAAVAPALLLAVEFLLVKRPRRSLGRRWVLFAPVFLLLAAVLYVSFAVRGYRASNKPPIHYYVMTQAWVHLLYMKLLVFPIGQNLDHDVPLVRSLADPRFWAGSAAVAATLAAAFLARRKAALATLGVLWYYITLSVTSSIVSLWDVMFEHRLYPALAGFAMVLVGAAAVKREHMKAARTAGIALVVVFAALANLRNYVWRTPLSLWYDAVKKSPAKARPNYNYAAALFKEGAYDQALVYLERCKEIEPAHRRAYDLAAQIHHMKGDLERAERNFKKALELKPTDAQTLNNYGLLLVALGRKEEAFEVFKKAAEHARKDYPDPFFNLGVRRMERGEFAEAERLFARALEINPKYVKARQQLGRAIALRGDPARANRVLEEALRLAPDRGDIMVDIGVNCLKQKDYAAAESWFLRALRTQRGRAIALEKLVGLYLETGDKTRAARRAEELLRIDPQNKTALNALGK